MLRGLKGSFLISLKLIVRNCNKAVAIAKHGRYPWQHRLILLKSWSYTLTTVVVLAAIAIGVALFYYYTP